MTLLRYQRRSIMPVSADELYRWHTRPGAFERLVPPWEDIRVERRSGGLAPGSEVRLTVPLGPARIAWRAVHRDVVEGRSFSDEQLDGPFRRWVHTHRFLPESGTTSWLEDTIEYEVPLGALGEALAHSLVQRRLDRTFQYRHTVTRDDVRAHAAYAGRPLRVAVSGSRGLIGAPLTAFLTSGGHEVLRLVRGPAESPDQLSWLPLEGLMEASRLEGFDAVVHLAGEGMGPERWTPERRQAILRSRVEGTRRLSEALAGLSTPPPVLVTASTIGVYGNRQDEILTGHSPPGQGFLANVSREWEEATEPARQAGIRVVHARFGLVLTPAGGTLKSLLLPFRLGLGGSIGSGTQYVSWIAIDDAVDAIYHALWSRALRGPVNYTAPRPLPNAEFTRILARVLRRPAIAPLPAAVARLLFGDVADEMLLASRRAVPAKLEATGFRFRFPGAEAALRHLLGRTEA